MPSHLVVPASIIDPMPAVPSTIAAGTRLATASAIMRVWLIRRRATRMQIALAELSQRYGVASPQVAKATAQIRTINAGLAPLTREIDRAAVAAGSARPGAMPIPGPFALSPLNIAAAAVDALRERRPPPKPGEFAELPDADWHRAWAAAGAINSPTFAQRARAVITADNAFWSVVDYVSDLPLGLRIGGLAAFAIGAVLLIFLAPALLGAAGAAAGRRGGR